MRALGLSRSDLEAIIEADDVCELMPTPTDGRSGRRLHGMVAGREVHVVLVANPGERLHTVTTVYAVDRRVFPDGRTRRRTS